MSPEQERLVNMWFEIIQWGGLIALLMWSLAMVQWARKIVNVLHSITNLGERQTRLTAQALTILMDFALGDADSVDKEQLRLTILKLKSMTDDPLMQVHPLDPIIDDDPVVGERI